MIVSEICFKSGWQYFYLQLNEENVALAISDDNDDLSITLATLELNENDTVQLQR